MTKNLTKSITMMQWSFVDLAQNALGGRVASGKLPVRGSEMTGVNHPLVFFFLPCFFPSLAIGYILLTLCAECPFIHIFCISKVWLVPSAHAHMPHTACLDWWDLGSLAESEGLCPVLHCDWLLSYPIRCAWSAEELRHLILESASVGVCFLQTAIVLLSSQLDWLGRQAVAWEENRISIGHFFHNTQHPATTLSSPLCQHS